MTNARWQRIQELFEQAVERSVEGRADYLAEACGSDMALRRDVESLLEHDSQADDQFLESSIPAPDWTDLSPLIGPDPLLGTRIGSYRIENVIAHGGMGTVYEAIQKQPHRVVALKVMDRGVASRAALRRFQFESQVLGQLRHPHVAHVYEAGMHEIGGVRMPYFALEHIAGARTLIQYAKEKRLNTSQRLRLFAKVCDAVQHGHQKGIIHRDLKPSNILVGRDGQPKVIDFGVARSTDADIMMTTLCTQTGELIGTVHYMSPEQCGGDSSAIDTRTDIYSLGMVLYELLTDNDPYDTSGTAVLTALRVIKEEPPRRPSEFKRHLRGDVEAILLKALEKDPARRYQSATAFVDDLRRFLAGDPVSARMPSAAYRIGRYVQRKPWQVGVFTASAFVLLSAIITVLVWNARNDAVSAHRLAEVRSYGAKITAADAALEINDSDTALSLLKQAQATSLDLCGWEWRHLMSRVDQSINSVLHQNQNLTNRDDVVDIAISPDGAQIAVVLPDGTLEVVSCAGEPICTLVDTTNSTTQAYKVAWSHDGTLLAATMSDRDGLDEPVHISLGLWRTTDLTLRLPDVHWHVGIACQSTLAFHPSRRLLVTDGRDDKHGLIALWNLENFDECARDGRNVKPAVVSGAGVMHGDLAWSSDGNLLASFAWETKEIQIWDFSQAPQVLPVEPLTSLHGHTYHILDLAFSPRHPKILASASLDGTVRLWDLSNVRTANDSATETTPQSISAFDVLRGHEQGAIAVCFDPWGRRVFVGGLGRTLHVWDVEQINERFSRTPRRKRVNTLRGHNTRISRICSLSDGRVASISSDGVLKIWAPDAEDVPLLLGHTSSVHAAAFSPDGRTLFTICGNAHLFEWDLATCIPRRWWIAGRNTQDMRLLSNSSELGVVLAGTPDDKQAEITFATLTDNGALNVTTRLCIDGAIAFKQLGLASDQRRLIASGVGPQLYVWSRKGRNDWGGAQVYDSAGAFVMDILVLDDHARWVVICTKLRDSDAVNSSLQLWDFDTGQRVVAPLENNKSLATISAFDSGQSQLAVGTWSGPILLFDVNRRGEDITLEPVGRLDGHTQRITALTFHPSERRLVSSAKNQSLKIWDLETKTEIATLHGHPTSAACLVFDADGERLVSGSGGALGTDNVARVWGTQRSPDHGITRATAMRAYREARRHLRIGVSPAQTIEAIKSDPTLPIGVREFAADGLLTCIEKGEAH